MAERRYPSLGWHLWELFNGRCLNYSGNAHLEEFRGIVPHIINERGNTLGRDRTGVFFIGQNQPLRPVVLPSP